MPLSNQMTRAYWDSLAGAYERHVLSVFDRDVGRVVEQAIARVAATLPASARAADLGCGVGKFTPLLAEAFSSVEACDFSPKSLELARRRCAGYANTRFHQIDFAVEPAPFAPVEFVLCVNVLIMPDLDERMRAWRFVANQVAEDGQLLLVVPSLESAMYVDYRMIDHHLCNGLTCDEAVSAAIPHPGNAEDLRLGVRTIEGMRTKYYLGEELRFELADRGYELLAMERVEYAWSSICPDLPEDTCEPRPWDWMVVARRKQQSL